MNNSDLDSILRKARIPQPTEVFWEELPQRLARQSNRSRTENIRPQRTRFKYITWGFAMATCLLIGIAIGMWHAQMKSEKDVLADTKFIQQTLAMFPNQVRAIVSDEHGLNLVLSETGNMPSSPPIYVQICDGKNCGSAVTFSGQEIQVAGQRLTVLSEADGGIILEGKNFIWTDNQRSTYGNRLKIEAKNISPATL